MHNVHVSRIRSASARPHAADAYPSAEDIALVDAAAFRRLVVKEIARELQAMPEAMRQAVMLAAVSTEDYSGMAAQLQINVGTFRSRLARGRQRLRTQFTSATVC